MKKLVLSFAVIASMSLFACGSSEKQAEAVEEAPVEEAVVEEAAAEVVDSIAPDSVEVAVEATEAAAE